MNLRIQRPLFIAGALLLLVLGAAIVLQNRPDTQSKVGAGESGDKRKSLTAIKKNPPKPESNPGPATPARPPVEINAKNLLAGKVGLLLTSEEVDDALESAGRTPENLIAAQAVLGDHRYLREAAEEHPDDPQVQFWILANRVLPEERAAWLEKFKASDPDNAMGNYLAAQEAFRAQDVEAGIAELRAAAQKGYRDYSDDLQKGVGKMYKASGKFGEEDARNGSARAIAMPHANQLQGLSRRLLEQHEKLRAAEKFDEAAELIDLGMGMLETVAGNSTADAIGTRTSMLLMQEEFQRAAGDPEGKLAALTAERERVGGLIPQVQSIFAREGLLDEVQLEGYSVRLHDLGEVGAAEWLVEQVGELPPE